ncbi:MAG: hypothetical protein JRE56_03975 [Deltaproteobacteria bacterium]|nr:hypothetical protein [Deltaproteobacteria bacterium]MBW2512339.1 hypothetical protein [Deltaproteobacteria bacterium]MDH4007044.1 hypothetical protein [Desulfuromonadales bacterium]
MADLAHLDNPVAITIYAAALAAASLKRLVPKAGSKPFWHALLAPIQGGYYRIWSRMLLIRLMRGLFCQPHIDSCKIQSIFDFL